MSNRFYFTNSDDEASNLSDPDPDNDAPLPFPKPLDRSSFLSEDFDPTAFLSSLSNRFQTLEDLQDELRQLTQSLNKELVDLVNDNYQDFLSLGSTLAGGDEKVEEIRVGLLGFQRDISGVREKIDTRRQECERLLTEKKGLRREIARGRVLLEIAERVELLEVKLKISKSKIASSSTDGLAEEAGASWSEDWHDEDLSESDGEYENEPGVPRRLRDALEDFQILQLLMKKHDAQHPFLVSQRERVARIHDTIRMDLEAAVRLEEDVKVKQKIIQLRASLDA